MNWLREITWRASEQAAVFRFREGTNSQVLRRAGTALIGKLREKGFSVEDIKSEKESLRLWMRLGSEQDIGKFANLLQSTAKHYKCQFSTGFPSGYCKR